MVNQGSVLFYSGKGYMFDNFSSFCVFFDGILWMTVEHAYQAAKFTDPSNLHIKIEIKNATSAHEAKQIAKRNKDKARPDWENVKLSVMELIIRAKLAQHSYIQKELLETGDLEMIEDSPEDSYWGRGPDWKGQNHMGKIWMKLRKELKEKGE